MVCWLSCSSEDLGEQGKMEERLGGQMPYLRGSSRLCSDEAGISAHSFNAPHNHSGLRNP